ncbi:hypothetical protein ACFODL_15430 [Phenylobacterium terrae]|uniref:Uncharacterized protein n=1 Tax=Phenylobacterium terrae TaxID=2665495 RepID=A0ABW4N6J8_9CAUL
MTVALEIVVPPETYLPALVQVSSRWDERPKFFRTAIETALEPLSTWLKECAPTSTINALPTYDQIMDAIKRVPPARALRCGFAFKTAADAVAFKLRWSDEFEIVEVEA